MSIDDSEPQQPPLSSSSRRRTRSSGPPRTPEDRRLQPPPSWSTETQGEGPPSANTRSGRRTLSVSTTTSAQTTSASTSGSFRSSTRRRQLLLQKLETGRASLSDSSATGISGSITAPASSSKASGHQQPVASSSQIATGSNPLLGAPTVRLGRSQSLSQLSQVVTVPVTQARSSEATTGQVDVLTTVETSLGGHRSPTRFTEESSSTYQSPDSESESAQFEFSSRRAPPAQDQAIGLEQVRLMADIRRTMPLRQDRGAPTFTGEAGLLSRYLEDVEELTEACAKTGERIRYAKYYCDPANEQAFQSIEEGLGADVTWAAFKEALKTQYTVQEVAMPICLRFEPWRTRFGRRQGRGSDLSRTL